MILLAILASAAKAPEPPKVERRARATVTVVAGREISASGWKPEKDASQREVVHVEPDGRTVTLRLVEFQ